MDNESEPDEALEIGSNTVRGMYHGSLILWGLLQRRTFLVLPVPQPTMPLCLYTDALPDAHSRAAAPRCDA